MEEHQGETKRGEHWYKPGEATTWDDTFLDEERDIENKFTNFWEWIKYMCELAVDAFMIMFDMSKGFFDKGQSFDDGFALLDKDYHQTEWLSEETLQMIKDERDTYMVYWDFSTRGPQIFWDWWIGRLKHLREIEPVPLVENAVLYVLVTLLTAPGKFSLLSPLFTGWGPTVLTFNCVSAQFIGNLWINRYFAEGNFYLIGMQIFTITQWLLMLLLVWDVEIYLYDFRILRYFSELGAFTFAAAYLTMVGMWLDLVFVQGSWEKDVNIFDLLGALFVGYNLGLHAPTMIVNVLIIGKELTLNPLAWRKDQDFEKGTFYNLISLDIFYWLGIGEDPNQYW